MEVIMNKDPLTNPDLQKLVQENAQKNSLTNQNAFGGCYPNQGVCPSCGHCPTCGRGGYQIQPNWPYPYYYWNCTNIGLQSSGINQDKNYC